MAAPKSISARQVSAAAKRTVAKVLKQHGVGVQSANMVLGFVRPPWWWIGLVLRKSELDAATAKQVARDVQGGIVAALPAVRGGKPGAVIKDGVITLGFAPPKEIEVIQE